VNWNEDDGDGVVELCPADSGGDIDGFDDDPGPEGNHVDDDIFFGWCMYRPIGEPSDYLRKWNHPVTPHGTKVAGILGAISNNGSDGNGAVASIAGGDYSNPLDPHPGVRLIQFSFDGYLIETGQIQTFHDARTYGAKVYSSSAATMFATPAVRAVVESLGDSMLFVQAVGNDGRTPMTSDFAKLPKVMAVGGYDCEFGGRWIVPENHQPRGWKGSDYGPELSVMGPTGDDKTDYGAYKRMVMASTSPTGREYDCDPAPLSADETDCFGGTSAAAPGVASVAALVFSYAEERPEVTVTPERVWEIIEHTAEDIQCDSMMVGCECRDPDEACAVTLLGWDQYTGFGRVDAGRALTLPIAVLDTLDLPHTTFVRHWETLPISWEAFDINTENDVPVVDSARFELHYLIPEDGLVWHVIDDSIPPGDRSFNWTIYDSVSSGSDRRIRLTTVDSGGHVNHDYSVPFSIFPIDESGVPEDSPLVTFEGIAPNPTSKGTRIRYVLGKPAHVAICVYDAAGRHIRTLAQGNQAAGSWTLEWDGRNGTGRKVACGVYFIRLDLGTDTETVRLVLVQ